MPDQGQGVERRDRWVGTVTATNGSGRLSIASSTFKVSRSLAASLICGALAAACGGSPSTATTSGTGGHGTGVGGANTGSGGMAGAGAAGMTGAGGMAGVGAAGSGTAGSNGGGGTSGAAGTVPIGGTTGVFSCTPGREELIITDCGYPNATNNPLSSTVFNENEVLRAIRS